MKFDHNKYFKKALKKFIQPGLKKVGFSKRGTLTFVRKTEDNIIQVINFQRSRYDSRNFYVNVGNLTLYKLQSKFFPEVGYRIHQYDKIAAGFNCQAPIIGDISLKDINKTILEKILPYFDYTSSVNNIYEFSVYATKNKDKYPFLSPFSYKERTCLPADESLALMHLYLENYELALDIYKGIRRRKYNPETKEWDYLTNNDYDSIINEIELKQFTKIENRIKDTIQQSLINTKFAKLKTYRTTGITLEELMDKLTKNSQQWVKRSTFPFHYYKIYTRNDLDQTLSQLIIQLEKKYKLEITEHKFIAHVDEDFSFYLAINDEEYVAEESTRVVSEYKGKKDISWIKSSKRRIEFWSDNDKNMDYFNEHLYVIQSWKNIDLELLHGDKLVFFDEE